MKRCPTCQRTFDDNMKFCQSDGTPLVSDTAGAGGMTQDAEFDPMKTVLGAPPPVDLPPPSPFGSPSADLNSPSFGDLGGSSPRGSESSGGFSDAPRTPTFQEPEPPFGQNFGQQPFGNAPSDWTPPPAPAAGWGNQGLGQNTPFTPPPVGAGGQNQVIPIISLISGIVSIFCCWLAPLLGALALILGFMGMNNVKKNPSMYGGRGLALGGMITGGIGLAVGLLYWILVIFGSIAGNIR